MITGMRSQTARTPLIRPSTPPKAMPMPAAMNGSTPATIALAAMTAEKLNIQPTDRSMSRMTTTNTIARASMPMNAAPESCWNRVAGRKKFGRRTPTIRTRAMSATSTPVSSGRRRRRRARVGADDSGTGSGSVADVPAVTCLLTPRVPRSHGRVSVRHGQAGIQSRDRRYRKRFDEMCTGLDILARAMDDRRPTELQTGFSNTNAIGVRQLSRRSDA